jgi:hypothetical protein
VPCGEEGAAADQRPGAKHGSIVGVDRHVLAPIGKVTAQHGTHRRVGVGDEIVDDARMGRRIQGFAARRRCDPDCDDDGQHERNAHAEANARFEALVGCS